VAQVAEFMYLFRFQTHNILNAICRSSSMAQRANGGLADEIGPSRRGGFHQDYCRRQDGSGLQAEVCNMAIAAVVQMFASVVSPWIFC